MWRKSLAKITPYEPGKPIEEVKRELGLKKAIKLASNENPIGPSKKVIKAIERAANNVNRYPDGGCFYLRQALSKKLSVPEKTIVFGNGSDEIILLALRASIDSGDEVVVANPTFLIYNIASMVKGAKVRTIPLKEYKYDLKGMLAAINKRTKVVFIANPDNPTGSYVTGKELSDFIENVPAHVLIFIDEAYYEFARGSDYPETLGYIKRKDKNIIIARTFSKAYSLAGLRIGYGITREDIAEVLNKVREPFNVNSVAQRAALAALQDNKYLAKSVALVKKEMEKLKKAFNRLDIKQFPSRTNFILIDTERDSKKIFSYLLKHGIIVREMSKWGLKGHIRVNVGLPRENDRFLKVFKEAIHDYRT